MCSRGDPRGTMCTIFNLFSMAAQPGRLEIVLRVDSDDPALIAYCGIEKELSRLGLSVKLVVGPSLGYMGLNKYYQESYIASTGDLLLIFGHEVRVLTFGFDDAYRKACVPYGVCSSHYVKTDDTDAYEWAMPLFDRALCEKIGCLCLCTPPLAYDRVAEAYGRISQLGRQAMVLLRHPSQPEVPGTPRGDWLRYCHENWKPLCEKWDADAKRMNDLVNTP